MTLFLKLLLLLLLTPILSVIVIDSVSSSKGAGGWGLIKMLKFDVGGKVVERVDLLRKKQWPWRFDVWPFAILYAVWLTTILPTIDIVDAAIVFGAFLAVHILVCLFTAWSVDFKCFVQYSQLSDIHQADSCKVTPAEFSGSKEVVPLNFHNQLGGSSTSVDTEEIYFDFRKQRFFYSKENENLASFLTPQRKHLDTTLKALAIDGFFFQFL